MAGAERATIADEERCAAAMPRLSRFYYDPLGLSTVSRSRDRLVMLSAAGGPGARHTPYARSF